MDMSEQYNRFLPLLKKGARILDVGSGSGRDACCFQRLGYQVTALEPSGNLCREIRRVFPGEIVCSNIQNYRPGGEIRWDLGLCLFAPSAGEGAAAFFGHLNLYLKEDGIIYVSGKNGISTGKAADGRYFLEFTEALLERILAVNPRLKLEEMWYTEDATGRQGFRWMNIIIRLVC